MNIRTEKVISVQEWDKTVKETYRRPYSFQQQDGCRERGVHRFKVPDHCESAFTNDTVPEIINHKEMGVSFSAWLARDPNQRLTSSPDREFGLSLWWARNFYPDLQEVANDLWVKGILPPGDYSIDIDW